MSASARPHKAAISKPEQCPECGREYAFRYRGHQHKIRTTGYACTHAGWTYVHGLARHPSGVLS